MSAHSRVNIDLGAVRVTTIGVTIWRPHKKNDGDIHSLASSVDAEE
jgi:hypothetical protein